MTSMVLTAAGGTLAAGLIGCLIVWLLRGRSVVTTMTLTALTAVLAAVCGVVISAEQMFISGHDVELLASIAATAAVVGSALALAVGLQVASRFQQHAVEAAQQESALAVEASRRELVAWMSHDLRSPLVAIRAMIEAIDDGVVDDPATVYDYHRAIRSESLRLNDMVDDLFTLARMHDGRLSLNKQRVTLADIVAQAIPVAAPLAEARGISLRGDGPEIPIDIDVSQMSRVMGNLLSNAIRHTPEGTSIIIDGGRDGQDVYVAVEDECGGIPSPDLARVFDVAFRGSVARTPSHDGGAGLGLAIARGIVDAHGGDIDVRNIGTGCRFTVRFPILPETAADQPAPTSAGEEKGLSTDRHMLAG